ncbi:MAG: hypothetical protein ACU0FH_02075 [Heliomarina sp.]|uniref:hypothetical protein n=1 Tax=Heliomarina sp. TaxID=2917556 RepID=UPI004058A276
MEALNRKLDPGQMLGNGAGTKKRIVEIADDEDDGAPKVRPSDELPLRDPDRYELARIQKVEEEARKLRRANAEAEGSMVLTAAVHRQVAKQIGQEIAEFETVLREAARKVADRLGVDYRSARQIMIETWRDHRGTRQVVLEDQAEAAELSEEEAEANF